MDHGDSPGSSLQSTGDTSQLLQELMNLQKSGGGLATGSFQGSLTQVHESAEAAGSGDATNPTLAELMMTMYDAPIPKQVITLQGTDAANSFSVYGREVDIMTSIPSLTEKSTTGSNKVKATPVVKYEWESMHYVGNLVAVHRNNVFAAYSLRGKSGGVVRIVNRKTAERALLKDLVGKVVDLAFAHTDDIIIAAVDEIGNLFVHEVKESEDKKLSPVLLCVKRSKGTPLSDYHRVIWCPFIPDDCDDSSITESSTQDASRVLVLTHVEKAEIWNIEMVAKEHDSNVICEEDVEFGLIRVANHTQAIVDAAFSPDGTALATASLDGEVKFFQVNMNETSSPRCLHQWKPHDGKQLSCLFFLDDHKNANSESQFWKFAVTGACNNQELRVWSCESWTCLQTVRFLCPPNQPTNFTSDPCMKAGLDLSARYLVLSDIRRQVLYILQIHQDGQANAAHISSVSEFMLASPCLSFSILDASKKKFKKSLEDSHLDEITTGELDREEAEDGEHKPDQTVASGVQLRLYTVHPKALQELLIRFRPESSAPPAPTPSVSTISHDETGLRDALSDMSMSMDTSVAEGDSHRGDVLSQQLDSSHPVLLTPDAFTSTSPRKLRDSIDQPVRASGSSTSSFTQVTGLNDELFSPHSSGDHSALSEGSTITQTPTGKETSPSRFQQDVTPSSVPLPPITSVEESDLQLSDTQDKSEEGETTPKSHERLNNVCIDDMFDSTRQSLTQTLESVGKGASSDRSVEGTTSTTGFDVGELSGPQRLRSTATKESYDENDVEVAEVLGESYKEEEQEETEPMGTQPFEGEDKPRPEGEEPQTSWPNPPEVSSQGELQTKDMLEQSEYTEDDDDVRVEEEEEVLGEEEEEEEEGEDSKGYENQIPEGDSEEIEEVIEEQSEESEQDGPKEAPVAKTKRKLMSPTVAPVKEIHHREVVRETVDKEALRQLTDSVQVLMAAIEAQNSRIEQLQDQLTEHVERQTELQQQRLEHEELTRIAHQPQPNIEEHLGKLESIVTSRVERLFTQHAQRENQRTKELLQHTDIRDKQRQDRLEQTLIQSLNNAVSSNVERQVQHEMRNVVLPNVKRIMEPLKDQLHHDLAQKLTATDSLLKDNIGKMVRSKQTVETLGMAASHALQTPIQTAYREAFQNFVVPNFERATQNLFTQLNEAFVKGTKENIRHLDARLDEVRQKHQEARDPIVGQLRKLTDSFQTSAEAIQTQVLSTVQNQVRTELQQMMSKQMSMLQDSVVQYVRQAVKEEVSMAVREQGASISDSVLNAMRSGAVTPVHISPDPHQAQTHVLQLLRQGQLNAAFQHALSASNLDLVVFVCETVNPSQVFNQTPCPLQQPVLLSLIQQLSADLGNNTELKHKYLEEAVMNLDTANPVTREHMKGVLYGLIEKLKTYITAHPNDKTTRSLRMLQMASQSLLK